MTKTYLRKRSHYTEFRKLKPGDRFRFSPSTAGPFTKFGRRTYEDARVGDDLQQTWTNATVRKLWPAPIEPN